MYVCMADQGDLDLDVASPVAGRSSNASADRQALAKLAKKLKAQQAEISSLHQDKRALQVGVLYMYAWMYFRTALSAPCTRTSARCRLVT